MADDEIQTDAGNGAARRRTRREFLSLGGSAALGLALAACAPAPQPTPAPAAKPAAPPAAAPAEKPAAAPAVVSKERKEIVVSVWGGLTEDGLRKAVTPAFEKKYNATVTYDIGGGSVRYNKLRAQATNPQINVFFNTEDIQLEAAELGLLARMNPANVPNVKDLHDWAAPRALEGLAVAYAVTSYGLMMVKDKVKTPVTSWKDLWRDEFKGKLAFTAPVHTQASPMLILASELHGGSAQNIEPGLKALAELRPVKLYTFWTEYAPQLKSGEVILAPEFDYYGLFIPTQGYDVTWVLPGEKAFGTMMGVGVVKGAPNQELAEGYVNTMLDPEVQAEVARVTFQAPSNKLTKLTPPLSEQVMYGSRLQQLRWFDPKFIAANKTKWIERINTEVVPKWRL